MKTITFLLEILKTTLTNLELLSKAIDLRVQRNEVIASNFANADTPNYKACDIDFKETLQLAVNRLQLSSTNQGHLSSNQNQSLFPEAKLRAVTQGNVDGNTVDMDTERTQFSENAMQYQILTTLIQDEFKDMKLAISSNNS